MPAHKILKSPYLLLPIIILSTLFDLGYWRRRMELERPGIASYLVPQDLAQPTARLIEETYLSRIRTFSNRDTTVVVSNSLGAGTGARNRQFLNEQLESQGRNVLNAAISGEYLSASAALAAMGIQEVIQSGIRRRFNVFLIYSGFRFYVTHDYWQFGEVAARACRERQLAPYIHGCNSLKPMSLAKELRADVERYFFGNMRCIISPDFLRRWARDKRLWCGSVFYSYEPHPSFNELEFSASQIPAALAAFKPKSAAFQPSDLESTASHYQFKKFPERNIASEALILFTDPAFRKSAVDTILSRAAYLERLFKDENVDYSMNFILVGDHKWAIESLTKDEANSYFLGRNELVAQIRSKRPNWESVDLAPFPDKDYYDSSHLNELGQIKLASIINNMTATKTGKASVLTEHSYQ